MVKYIARKQARRDRKIFDGVSDDNLVDCWLRWGRYLHCDDILAFGLMIFMNVNHRATKQEAGTVNLQRRRSIPSSPKLKYELCLICR